MLDGREWLLAWNGTVCTGLAYTMLIHALEQAKARTVTIVSCMEPMYAIALA